jgi:hypothetical protein
MKMIADAALKKIEIVYAPMQDKRAGCLFAYVFLMIFPTHFQLNDVGKHSRH